MNNLDKLGRIVEQKKCTCEANCGSVLSVIDQGRMHGGLALYFTNAILDDEGRVVEVRYVQDGMVNGHTSLSKVMETYAKKWLIKLGIEEEEEENG